MLEANFEEWFQTFRMDKTTPAGPGDIVWKGSKGFNICRNKIGDKSTVEKMSTWERQWRELWARSPREKKKLVFLENIEPKIDGLAERTPHAEVSKYPF